MSDMRNLLNLVNELSTEENLYEVHDQFDIELDEETLIEAGIVEILEDGILIECDDVATSLLEAKGLLSEEDMDESALQAYLGKKKYGEEGMKALQQAGREGASKEKMAQIRAKHDKLDEVEMDETKNLFYEGLESFEDMSDEELIEICRQMGIEKMCVRATRNEIIDILNKAGLVTMRNVDPKLAPFTKGTVPLGLAPRTKSTYKDSQVDEAKYQGREVPLGKPMQGDVAKSKVYVKGPKGNVVKVNFGDKNMRIKKSNPGRRKNFRARHNCKNPGPRWKARYWSCRAW